MSGTVLRRSFRIAPVAVAALAAIAVSCREERPMADAALSSTDVVHGRRVAQARIFFAHQSVGQNIVDGLTALGRSDGRMALNIVDGREPGAGPFFVHRRLGTNGNPYSKTDEFVAVLGRGLGNRLDVALQKYCFADIDATTDVRGLFDHYRSAMEALHHRFPNLTLVHVTAPLTTVQSGPKAFAKKLLGRMPDHYADNFRREQFNDLMRTEYFGREPLFDLAAVEASDADGTREIVRYGSATSRTLAAENTTDGGHLSEAAQRRAAKELLAVLAGALESPSGGAARR